MATFESWGVDVIPSTEHHSAITVILNTDIETLTAFKDTLEATPKADFRVYHCYPNSRQGEVSCSFPILAFAYR
jgi:hypothetical protein